MQPFRIFGRHVFVTYPVGQSQKVWLPSDQRYPITESHRTRVPRWVSRRLARTAAADRSATVARGRRPAVDPVVTACAYKGN